MEPWFAIPNNAATETRRVKPWELPEAHYPTFKGKNDFRAWCLNEKTQHTFYSGVEGINPLLRVSQENPAFRIHGLVADWDSPSSVADLAAKLEKVPLNHRPQWLSNTFSGNVRGVWIFEEPVWADDEEVARRFVQRFFHEVQVEKMMAGFDKCSLDLMHTWELGRNWKHVEDSIPTPKTMLDALRTGAILGIKKAPTDKVIPLEVVAEEIERLYGPRLFGARIEKGNRVPLFWLEADAKKKDRSALVVEWGLYAFSSRAGKGRIFWDELLGKDFVKQYEQRRISSGVTDTYYVNGKYWRIKGRWWIADQRDNMILRLKNQGFESTKKKGATASEVEQVLFAIQESSPINAVAPFPHTPERFVEWSNQLYLNINTNQPCEPSPEGTGKARENFPWLHEYLTNLLHRHPTDVIHPIEYIYAELQRAYRAIRKGTPTSGHAIIISGANGKGKSFLTTKLLKHIFGSATDAGKFLVEGLGFNKEMGQSFIWYVDDNRSAATLSGHRVFTETLKKHVATPEVRWEAKYIDSTQLPFYGRVWLTCNEDPESVTMIPDLDMTIRDKVSLFRIDPDRGVKFLPNEEMDNILKRETPYFLRWLLDDYRAPEEITEDATPRYGIREYHHPDLLASARENSPLHRLAEIIDLWREFNPDATVIENRRRYWVGNSSALLGQLCQTDSTKPLVHGYTTVSFGRAMSGLFRSESYSRLQTERGGKSGNSPKWKIEL